MTLASQEKRVVSNSIVRYLDYIHSGLYIIDSKHQTVYWNNAAEQITGYSCEDMTSAGDFCCSSTLAHSDADGNLLCYNHCPLKRTLIDGQVRDSQVYLHHKQGHLVEVAVRCFPTRDPGGKLIGAGLSFVPVSNPINLAFCQSFLYELAIQSYYDSLTGLKNRRFAESLFIDRLQKAKQDNLPFGLLFFDIDAFKSINDQYGHDIGDLALKNVSHAISESLRPGDTVIRWGGDEFIVVLSGTLTVKNLRTIANRLCSRVASLKMFDLTPPLTLTISMGGTLSRMDDSVKTLVRRADQNMYISKRNGGNMATISLPCYFINKKR